MSRAMLEGVRVVELATVLAAPSVGAAMADYGADVIKVEAPAGDMWRKEGIQLTPDQPHSVMFDNSNRGKKSVVLELKNESDMAVLHKLLEGADVFLTNVTQPALKRLGLDYDSVKDRYPRLVFAQLTAWGREGPGADRPGYDVGAWWAATGIMDGLRSGEDAKPPRYLSGLGDMTTAPQLLAGVALALFDRERTGRGQLVDVCLLRSGLYVLGSAMVMAAATQHKTKKPGFNPERMSPLRADRTNVMNPAMNNYKTKDGKYLMLMGVEFGRHMPKILQVLGLQRLLPELKNYPKNRQMLIQELDHAFAQKTEAEWIEVLDAGDVWYTTVRKYEDMVEDHQAIAARSFVTVPGIDHKVMSGPIVFSGSRDAPVARAPRLGQHTEEIVGPLRSKL